MRVTCIMPCSRNQDLPRAIDVFLSQDYKDKELLIGLDSLEGNDLSYLPEDSNVFTFYEGVKETIGAKRNRLCGAAKGDIIMHQDSDDYYAPDWITRSVQALGNNDMTGLNRAYFASKDKAWIYEYRGSQPYCIGASMCYRKSMWERNKFIPSSYGEDTIFCGNAGRIKPHKYIGGFVAGIHDKNTASHNALKYMREVPFDDLPAQYISMLLGSR